MSGGQFNYDQYKIGYIADEVEEFILKNEDSTPDEYGGTKGRFYSSDVIEKFKEGLDILKKAQIYAQRIDWLVSDDDGEESFLSRLEKELKDLENNV